MVAANPFLGETTIVYLKNKIMKYIKYITVMASLFLLIVACGEKKGTEESSEADQLEVAAGEIQISKAQFDQNAMQLGTLRNMPFPEVIQVNGMIDVPPENRAVVNATMGGYIKATPFLIGDAVKKGQALVTLENPEFVMLQQSFLEVHEQLSYLKAEYERQMTMKAENITSQKSFLMAESAYKTALAKHSGLEKQLQMINISPAKVIAGEISAVTQIYAPISGSITKVNVTKGSYVSPATEIMEIIDNEHIHLELSVFEKDIMQVKKGQEISFRIPEASKDTYKAEVHLVGTSIDANRTIKVHGHLEDKDEHHFLTGMFVDAAITTEMKQGLGISSEAIVSDGDNYYLLVLKEEKEGNYVFDKQEVIAVTTYEGFTEIELSQPINENAQILIKGAFNLIGE
jgi:cobalt-zinc-cadmium efflux system membrane fusion protein